MQEIRDYQHYDEEMSKSMMDKLFFIDKINATVFLDYGCADGTLFEHLNRMFPKSNFRYYGYDFDPEMIRQANEKSIWNAFFSTDLSELMEMVGLEQKSGKKTALVLSFVLHEIYSYQDNDEIAVFWQFVQKSGFDYIVVRDMIDYTWINKHDRFDMEEAIRKYANTKQLEDFEKIWGNFYQGNNMVHFLLKYRYTQNWKREVEENYLALTESDYDTNLPQNYDRIYNEVFVHPFIAKQIEKDFNIKFDTPTHIKLILEKE